VEAAIREPLRTALTRNRNQNPVEFKENYADGQVVAIIFFAFEHGVPAVVFLGFMLDDLNAPELKVKSGRYACPGDCTDGHFNVFVPWRLEAKFRQGHPEFWKGDALKAAENADAFIRLAIDQRLSDVGPPISVLALDSPRAKWIRAGDCTP